MADLTVNELLCFVWVRSDKLPRDHIHAALHEFYTLEEITLAKNTLLVEFDKCLGGDLIKEARKKRQVGNASVKHKLVKDILDIWQVVDKEAAGKLQTTFVAADINRLPPVNADNANFQMLLSAIGKIQAQSESLKEEAANAANSINVISNTLIQVNCRLDAQVQGSAAVSAAINASFGAASPAFHSPTPFTPSRSMPFQPVDGNRKRKSDDISAISPSSGAISKLSVNMEKKRKKSLNSEAPPFTPTSASASSAAGLQVAGAQGGVAPQVAPVISVAPSAAGLAGVI